MPIKIFHTADLHIGLKFANADYPPQVREALHEARFSTLANMVKEAGKRDCRLMVIAGDLFEHIRPTNTDILRVTQELKTFTGDVIAVLPGNHDPLSGDFWKTFKENAGERVLLLEKIQPYPLQEYGLNVVLYPAPCFEKHSESGTNQIGWIKDIPKEPGMLHIGVAHGSVEGLSPDEEKRYYLMTREELESAGVSLWLMGHNHSPYPVTPGLRDRIFYPGTHEPDSFNRQYPGSTWVHELVDDGSCLSERIITGKYRFLQKEITLESETDIAQLELTLLSVDAPSTTLLRLTLKGRLTKEELQETRKVIEKFKGNYFYFACDEESLGRRITPETITQEFSQDSFPYRLLQSLSDEGDTQGLQLAYELLKEMKEEK
jgi:DNA repair exonuclease SbcCD nuclease subunit